MQLLQGKHRRVTALHCSDSLHGSLCSRDRGNRRNACQYRRATDRLFVEQRVLSAWRVDDELNTIALDQIDYIRSSFIDFEVARQSAPRAPEHSRYPPWQPDGNQDARTGAPDRWLLTCRGHSR